MFPALLQVAVGLARGGQERNFLHAAVGVRKDGAIVTSRNGTANTPYPDAHAEARLSRKLDRGSVVYVARISKNGHSALSKPCSRCLSRMRNNGVKKVYYTIDVSEYGVIDMDQ